MKVNICGIQHTIIECDDHFDVDTHMGMIDYNKAEIRINKASAQPIKDATICHEVLHGLLVHIGREDLSTDEPFVTALGNAINGAFVLRGEDDDYYTRGRAADCGSAQRPD